MTVQWGKLVSRRVDPNDKAVQLRKAEKVAETILNVKLLSYEVINMICEFLDNCFKYPEIAQMFPAAMSKAMDIIRGVAESDAYKIILEPFSKNGFPCYASDGKYIITVFQPSKEEFGGVDLFIHDANGLLVDIPIVFTSVVKDDGFRVKVYTNTMVFETKEFKYLEEVVEYLISVRETVAKAVRSAVENKPAHPVHIPETFVEYLQKAGMVKIIETYDCIFESLDKCKVVPATKIVKCDWALFEISGCKVSWYPEDAIFKLIEGFAEAHSEYTLLRVDDPDVWTYNEEYGFWRYRFSHYYDSEGKKVYRMSKGFSPLTIAKFHAVRGYGLFKIVKVTKKSSWIEPVLNPVDYVLGRCGLKKRPLVSRVFS